jgi:DNA repair exonuclease SbcCD nuclease subunit
LETSKKPLFAIFNDMHLGIGNEEAVILSIKHMISKLLELGIDTAVFAGDFFHSRANQTESVLQAAIEIFRLLNEAGIYMYYFPGNHDKTSYYTHRSFLDSYTYYPNTAFNDRLKVVDIKGVSVTLLPFFADELLVPIIEEAEGSDLLISHFDMQGSTHLGKVCEKSSITKRTLKKWKKVYLGHYHNTHEISKDIVHLPSLRQSSFGEDSNKGFTIINEDLSYTIIPGVFKKFTKFVLNIDELTVEDIKELITIHSDSEDTVRFEFIGEETKLRSLDKEQFQGTGIDVKIKYQKKYQEKDVEKPVLIKKFEKNQIEDLFKEFCEEKDYSYTEGVVMLNEFLNKN